MVHDAVVVDDVAAVADAAVGDAVAVDDDVTDLADQPNSVALLFHVKDFAVAGC